METPEEGAVSTEETEKPVEGAAPAEAVAEPVTQETTEPQEKPLEKETQVPLSALKEERARRQELASEVSYLRDELKHLREHGASRSEQKKVEQKIDDLEDLAKQYPDDPLVRHSRSLAERLAKLESEKEEQKRVLDDFRKKEFDTWLGANRSALQQEFAGLKEVWTEDSPKWKEFLAYASGSDHFWKDEKTFRDGFKMIFIEDILAGAKTAAREDAVKALKRGKEQPIDKGGSAAGVKSGVDTAVAHSNPFVAKVLADLSSKS